MSLREYIGLITIVMLIVGLVATTLRLRTSETELSKLRQQYGYLSATQNGQIAAARALTFGIFP